ncbi:hypothetical protein ACJMK2_011924 [Sinanodonta woodiana]|uniref:Uncharacterized protein n=1 Tax=Sinanodonta woodiana TaxID=1069815 RepID=A0ABD3V6I8_SINWO
MLCNRRSKDQSESSECSLVHDIFQTSDSACSEWVVFAIKEASVVDDQCEASTDPIILLLFQLAEQLASSLKAKIQIQFDGKFCFNFFSVNNSEIYETCIAYKDVTY